MLFEKTQDLSREVRCNPQPTTTKQKPTTFSLRKTQGESRPARRRRRPPQHHPTQPTTHTPV